MILIALLACVSTAPVAAAGSEAPAMGAVPPDPDEIRALKAQAAKTGDIDKTVLEQINAGYDQALEQLEYARQWSDKANAFKASQAEVPDLLRELNAELARPAPPAGVEKFAGSGKET